MRTNTLLLAVLFATVAAARLAAQQPAPAPAPGAAQPAPAAAAPAADTGGVTVGESAPVVGTTLRSTDAQGRDTVTVDFPNEDIRSLLLSIADLFDLNIIVPETLQGRTSIKLRDVTWKQIFSVVLSPVGYTYVQEGNIIKVVSNESLTQEPTEIIVIPLSFATAASVQGVVGTMIDSAAGGKIQTDPRTNSLIITERPSRMDKIRDIVRQLDTATDQVMIETKFVEVTDGDISNIGVNWSALKNYGAGVTPGGNMTRSRGQDRSDSNDLGSGSTASQKSGSDSASSVAAPAASTATASTAASIAATADATLNALVSIANSASTARDFTAVFTADQFGLVLSALKELNTTKVVSNPTVVTVNNKEATISVGEQYPVPNYAYNEQRGSFEVSGFDYKAIGIIMKVTPQVNARGFITLSVAPEVSQRNATVNFGGASGAEIPIIAARKLTTNVQLQSGQTMGMGGMLTSQASTSSNKVPFFGDVPLIKYLFKSRSKNNSMTNLLIFITAHTLAPGGASVGEIFDPRQVRATGMKSEELPGFRDGSDPFGPATPASPPASGAPTAPASR